MVRVKLFEGNIPKKSKGDFSFSGIDLFFRNTKKECLVIHKDSKAVVMALPSGSLQSVALDYLAKHYNRLLHFISEPTSCELYVEDKILKQTKQELSDALQSTIVPISKPIEYSTRGIFGKKKINLLKNKY